MLRRTIAASTLFIATTSLSFAYNFYIAPSLVYQGISAGNVDYMGMSLRPAVGIGGPFRNSEYYIGGELFGNTKPMTFHNHRSGTAGLKPSYSVGASFLPGYQIDDEFIGYVRLGVIYTNFDNLDMTRRGWQIGAGLQGRLIGCWDVRGEYNYTKYRSITGIGTPKASEWLLGVVYKFG